MSRPPIFLRLVFVAAMGLLAAGCSLSPEGSGNADYRQGGNVERPQAGGSYTVQRGDTIYGVARQFGLSVRALIDANNLQPPYQLTVGQVLFLSTTHEYVVVKGDSLLGISHKTGVSYSTLARMNNITDPNLIKVGQRLKLPSTSPAQVAPLEPVSRPTVTATPVAPAPAPAQDSKKGGYATLADREKAAEAAPPPPPPPPAAPVAQPAPAPQQAAAAPAPAPVQAPPPKSGKGFSWPVRGEVISEFGAAGKGVHNDGINIAVPKGTPVTAAEDGVVAYAGNELRGFGNMLLVKHADGWMTAYAHNDQLLVKRGELVKRGQKIALSGDSGGVGQPQLHFELRQGTRAVDPQTMLKD
jgi:murein DD-endopeptidase MepM/ murein hydrolase activator NlpD